MPQNNNKKLFFNYHATLRVDAAQKDQYLCFALSKQSQKKKKLPTYGWAESKKK